MTKKNLINCLLFVGLLSTFVMGCKKGEAVIAGGNYIEINGDKRIIDGSNPNVILQYGTWGYPGYQFLMTDKQFSSGINGFLNNQIEVIVNIYDNGLSKTEYNIVDYTGNQTKGFAEIFVAPRKENVRLITLESIGNSGIVKYNLSISKRVIEFQNIKLSTGSGIIYTVSARMEFTGASN